MGPTARTPLFWGALLTIYLVWGSTYLAIRVMVDTVPPLLGAGLRFVLAGAIFLAFLVATRGRQAVRVSRAEVGGAAIAGAALLFGGNGLVTVAEQAVPSGLAALLIASVPLWVVVFRLLSRERVGRPTLIGVGVGFVGVALLVLPGERPDGAATWGIALIVAASASWAAGSYYSARLTLPADAILSTTMQMLCAGALMVVLALIRGEAARLELDGISGASALAFAYLVVAGSLLAFTAYTWLLRNAPISAVATYAYVNPVVAIVLGALILSEELTLVMLLAAGVIVASVAFVVTRQHERREPIVAGSAPAPAGRA
jgi:drug/metabolite transporter (DMT)-like permease